MAGLIALLAIVSFGAIIALFIIEYMLGKRKKKTSIGLIAPAIYLAFRVIVVMTTGNEAYEIMVSTIGACVFSAISLVIFFVTRNKQTKNTK